MRQHSMDKYIIIYCIFTFFMIHLIMFFAVEFFLMSELAKYVIFYWNFLNDETL